MAGSSASAGDGVRADNSSSSATSSPASPVLFGHWSVASRSWRPGVVPTAVKGAGPSPSDLPGRRPGKAVAEDWSVPAKFARRRSPLRRDPGPVGGASPVGGGRFAALDEGGGDGTPGGDGEVTGLRAVQSVRGSRREASGRSSANRVPTPGRAAGVLGRAARGPSGAGGSVLAVDSLRPAGPGSLGSAGLTGPVARVDPLSLSAGPDGPVAAGPAEAGPAEGGPAGPGPLGLGSSRALVVRVAPSGPDSGCPVSSVQGSLMLPPSGLGSPPKRARPAEFDVAPGLTACARGPRKGSGRKGRLPSSPLAPLGAPGAQGLPLPGPVCSSVASPGVFRFSACGAVGAPPGAAPFPSPAPGALTHDEAVLRLSEVLRGQANAAPVVDAEVIDAVRLEPEACSGVGPEGRPSLPSLHQS